MMALRGGCATLAGRESAAAARPVSVFPEFSGAASVGLRIGSGPRLGSGYGVIGAYGFSRRAEVSGRRGPVVCEQFFAGK